MDYMNQPNRFIQVLVVTLLMATLAACSRPKLAPIESGGTILAFGDSLTVGIGTTKINSYPSVLAELSGLEVINSGVSGETSDMGLKRLPNVLERVMPDLLILIEGGNDILRNRRKTEIKKNIKGMLEIAKRRNVPVVLIGVPNKHLFSNSAPFYKELAEQYQLVFNDSLISDLQYSPSLKSDLIHLNKEGYRKMAESIYKLLQENGALI